MPRKVLPWLLLARTSTLQEPSKCQCRAIVRAREQKNALALAGLRVAARVSRALRSTLLPFPPPAPSPRDASLPIFVPRPGATVSFHLPPQIILNAKCHAIRDAQILEKQLIQRELDAEERRLDQMMEVERQKSIQRQEELDRKRREERIR